MALARIGSIRDWTTIADDLDLPTTHADRIADFSATGTTAAPGPRC
jgi:hypothetical protein